MKPLGMLGVCLGLASILAFGRAAIAADLEVGDEAPEFQGKTDEGKTWKSEDYVGKKIVVVYFYPADFTRGCTKQACGFRDDMAHLKEKGVEVVGVSGDSVKGHELFKKHHELNFTLLADEDGSIAKKFGVPLAKGGTVTSPEIDGQTHEIIRGVTAQRQTFVIDKEGKIALKNDKVDAAEDSKAILAAVEKLQ